MKYIQVPKGVIVMWSGNSESVPDGWVICNGENGTTDVRDKFIVGAGSEDYPVGSTGGEKEITLTIAKIPAHDHTLDLSGKVLSGSGEWNFYHGDENVY
jgi:microcystin-dependent protein